MSDVPAGSVSFTVTGDVPPMRLKEFLFEPSEARNDWLLKNVKHLSALGRLMFHWDAYMFFDPATLAERREDVRCVCQGPLSLHDVFIVLFGLDAEALVILQSACLQGFEPCQAEELSESLAALISVVEKAIDADEKRALARLERDKVLASLDDAERDGELAYEQPWNSGLVEETARLRAKQHDLQKVLNRSVTMSEINELVDREMYAAANGVLLALRGAKVQDAPVSLPQIDFKGIMYNE